jgi:urease accessory protein
VRGSLDVQVSGGRVTHLACTPPLSAKVLVGPTLLIVGSAAGLLEGDRVEVLVRLDAGATLTVRTVAATLAHTCNGEGTTAMNVRAELGTDARLAWLPEPLVAHARCRHRSTASLDLEDGAAAVWSEAVTLGRHGEEAGDVALRFDAELQGGPLLRDGFTTRAAAGPAVLDGARHLGTIALLGTRPEAHIERVMDLAGPGALARGCAADAAALERDLAPARRAFLNQLFPPEEHRNVA